MGYRRAKAGASPSQVSQGVQSALHRDKTMLIKKEGRKHDKRQQLVGYLKRSLRKPWFMRLVIGVIWKLMDRYL